MTRRFEATVQRAIEDTELRKHTDGRTLYKAIATTPALDRYGEVVLPKGAIVENFKKNPVLLEGHNYSMSSVGHVVNLEMDESKMTFDFVFSTDDRGQELEAKFVAGDMNAFSIGFKPKAKVDLWTPWDDAPEIKEVKVSYPDGSEGTVDLTAYEHIPYRIYNQWELLEISPVSVPANPEALLLRQAEEIVRRVAEHNPVMKSFVQDELAMKLGPVMELLEKFAETFDGEEMKFEGAVASHSTPVETGSWSGANARTALAKWASKGGSGKKEDMNWSKYSKGFAWFDSKSADNFGAYKLPHHTVKDGALIAIWSGVTAAMAALLGARGGVDLDSKSAVYNHLARHYKDFDKEPPEMKEYSEEELKAIEDEPLVVQKSEDPADNSETVKATDANPDEEPPEDGEEEGESDDTGDATMMQMMSEMQKLLTQILTEIGNLKGKNAEAVETQEEHFIELQLKTEAISNLLEYNLKKAPQKEDPKVEETVVGEVPVSLIETLERIKSL
jgi:phage head maturation protease